MMLSLSFPTRSTDDVADAYVRSRGTSGFLSTARAIQTMRLCLPNCDATDRELEEIVVAAAVKRGVSIKLDVASAAVPASQRPVVRAS